MRDSRVAAWLRRTIKWKKWTYHHKTHLMYITTTAYGRVYTYHGQDYLVNEEGEVGKIPYYASLTIRGEKRVTKTWGPYKFINGFETTREAEYLMKMYQYPDLSDRAQEKVKDIFFEYGIWVEMDYDFISISQERERRLKDGKN